MEPILTKAIGWSALLFFSPALGIQEVVEICGYCNTSLAVIF
jgi:hypothetical protein